ncbi:MAG: hypothetical protein B7Z73_09695 [Planctomycetia bacterium 21-64-5]|nr:MAG: hypothetical protein B7Z73_09695 [Planctomycetia bacterium 21-64-5]
MAWGIALLTLLFICGCKESSLPARTQPTTNATPKADEEDTPITEAEVPMPANYAEAVESLSGYRDAIRNAIASGRLKDAHRPLDATDIAVDRLPGIARASGVPRRHWEQIVTSSEDLREALDEIHSQIDAHHKPDYALHAQAIDEALARLQAVATEIETPANKTANETDR